MADLGYGALKEPMKLFFQRQNISYRDLVEARRVLEIEISELAARRAQPEQIEEMRTAIEEMDGALEDVEHFVRTDQRFHLLLAQATQNRMFPMFVRSMSDLLYESRLLMFGVMGSPSRGQSHHRALLDALERRDAAAARRAMEEHIEQVDTDIHATGEMATLAEA